MALTSFSTPGNVDDLSARGRQAWSRDLGELFGREERGDPAVPNDSPRPQFFNPLGAELAADATTKDLRWGAFPRKLARQPAPRRWQLAEDRDSQEEYCEWTAQRDDQGRILEAFFTSEDAGYFHLLAADDPDRLLDLYRRHVGPDVQLRDLVSSSGEYRPRNRWNTAGAMHMVQMNNTIPAAVVLVAQSTIVRRGADGVMTNANDLIRCGVAADVDRNSDPLIVGEVNALARAGAAVTLDDPVGLYLDNLQTAGWRAPDGSDPADFWQVTRGTDGLALRAVYSVPADRGFTVSDIQINGRPITSASQIAEFVQIRIVGLAHGIGQHAQRPRGCRDDAGGAGLLADLGDELPRIPDLLAAVGKTR